MSVPTRVLPSLCRATNLAAAARSASLRSSPPLARTLLPRLQSQARCYVSSSGKKNAAVNAAVNVDVQNRAIDTQDFVNKTGGMQPSEMSIGNGLTADAMMSPSAGNYSVSIFNFFPSSYPLIRYWVVVG
jgi:cysteine desulfurase